MQINEMISLFMVLVDQSDQQWNEDIDRIYIKMRATKEEKKEEAKYYHPLSSI